ncbi:MAG: NifU family protein [Acidobacteriota bacterium]|nr:NifU family protein [Acidobacteriota bacterium]
MPKVINIEPTPNPDALKFLVNPAILKGGSRSFKDFGSAVGDPLGSALFALGRITSVFYMDRFVTVNKEPSAEWSDLIDPICEAIEELKLAEAAAGEGPRVNGGGTTDEVLARINDLIDLRIRPGLAGDGGGLEVIAFDGQTLEISYHGACGSCPSATTGTLRYIEGMLQEEVDPGIRVVSW